MDQKKQRIVNKIVPVAKKPLNVTTTEQGKRVLVNLTIDLNEKVKPQFDGNKCQYRPPYDSLIEIQYNQSDKTGRWSWNVDRNWESDPKSKSLIDSFYSNYHSKKTWKDVLEERCSSKKNRRTSKHKSYPVEVIIKEARERLVSLEIDDFEEIFRFRFEGKFRFYGFTFGNVFMALWHDPNHDIYPL